MFVIFLGIYFRGYKAKRPVIIHKDWGNCVQQTADGGYIVVGNTRPFGRIGEGKIYLIKTDGKGGKVWAKTFGGGDSAYGLSVRQATDGGYIIAGKK